MTEVKIVAFGDVNGQLSTFFEKLRNLHSKHQFSFAIVAGNLFADPQYTYKDNNQAVDDLINGKIAVPVTTYFNLGSHALPRAVTEKLDASDGEVCPNLYFMGRNGTLTTSDKVRIVNLGGAMLPEAADTEIVADKYFPAFTATAARSLGGARYADILLTSQWPAGIRTGSKKDFDASNEPSSSPAIAELCAVLKPKYHISASPKAYYEREPFFHPSTEDQETPAFHITRFISLAAFGNEHKAKSILAFKLDPTLPPPVKLDAGITTSPLLAPRRKRRNQLEPQFSRFANHNGMGGDRKHSHSRKKRSRFQHDPLADQQQCFFCTSNPNIATHIIVDVGVRAYLTAARGPLTTSSTYPELNCPGHVLIIPIEHAATLGLVEDIERKPTIAEMLQWRTSLNKMLKANAPSLGSVTWEVSRLSIRHTHWQFLPVPADLIRKGLLEAAFKVEAENEKYGAFEDREPVEDEKGDFFRVIIWQPDTAEDKHLLMPIDPAATFDIQFGRKVMAKLLGLEGREDWRDCGQTEDEETKDTAKLKELFKPHAPQIEG